MPALPETLARALRDRLGLVRAIETGTYRGRSARRLSALFPRVITIEIDPALARSAARTLARRDGIEVREGSSRDVLPTVVDATQPTLYWLDGHWSGAQTGGAHDECPVLGEIEALGAGHADDCILIDDARLFLAPPPPPHRAEQWPRYREVEDALAAAKPGHQTVVAHDVVVSVPARAADLLVEFAAPHSSALMGLLTRVARR